MSDLFQITGVSSGIAWDEIINKMLERGRKPATQWQNKIDTLEVKKTLYQELQSCFNKLRNTLTPLRLANAYKAKKAEYTSFSTNNVNPENILTAKVGADAELTWWDLDVKQLARAQRHTTTRFNSVSDSLGISGEFRIRVGKQVTTIKVEPEDNLREINYKISKAVDQDGNPIAVTAKILDNRIVLESAVQGRKNSGDTRGTSFTMGNNIEYYLPHSSIRDEITGRYSYPPQIFQLCYKEQSVDGSMYTYNYKEGVDFKYDASTGKITWLEGPGTRRPPRGAEFEVIYSEWLNSRRTSSFMDRDGDPVIFQSAYDDCDVLPFLPTGQDYGDLNRKFEIVGADGKEYIQGLDFIIIGNALGSDGKEYQAIQWLPEGGSVPILPDPPGGFHESKRPSSAYTIRIGADNNYEYDENVFYLEPVSKVTSTSSIEHGITKPSPVHPNLPSGMDYLPPDIVSSQGRIEITGSDNRKYREGIDYEIGTETISGVTYDVIEWLIPASEIPANYTVSKVLDHDYTEDSVLNKLGFITADPFNNANWKFTEGSYANASDAVFEIDGVEVKRSSNTVDDLIANVTLELRGLGQVRINIVRDLEKTVEDIQKVVDEYNSVMDWINFYVSQKQDAANPVDETNYLSSILQRSRGNTVFGALHGDQLLWSIKNQLRTRLSNPINAVSTSLTSRKVVNPASAMNIKSSFYVYVGGKAAKITVEPTDSMEDISKKLTDARNMVSNNGSTATGGSLGLNVTIRDGQLVIDGSRASSSQYATGERDTISSTFTRRSGNSEYLSFVPITSPPVSGELMVFSGRNPYTEGASTLYREGIDYNVVTSTENDTVSSRIEWISGRGPQPNGVYNVSYSYFPTAVTFSEIPGSGPMSSEIAKGWNDLSFLELRQDASKTTVSAFGITTESINYGKSGLIEFDSEKFLSMMESDPDLSASAMLTFMRDFDAYIGNLVDSSQILVAGQPVTKGRIAGALNKIDNEQKTLNDRITKLEKELEAKQTALYKQYSDMEVAIQKLNAQMNSIANYLNSLNKGN